MAEAWELVLHYTFAGETGVVFDHSPTRRSHGKPVNIGPTDFVKDGATPGSGAVRFHSPTSMIRVPPSESWRPLGGVRIEMVCETAMIRTGGALVDGGSFTFYTRDGYFAGGFTVVGDEGYEWTEGGSDPRPLPTDRWMTVAVQYDPSGVHAEVNGEVVARWEDWRGLLLGSSGVVIGNDSTGQKGLTGLVDDIKIWRLNPHFIGDKFTSRPVDISVARCWAEWSRTVDEVYASDPACASRVLTLLHTALFAMMGNIASLPNDIQADVNEYVLRYQEGWALGALDNVSAAVADLLGVLRRAGLDPGQLAQSQALLNDQCFATLRERLPILCDAQFTEIFNVSATL